MFVALVSGSGGGLYLYADREWRAAQLAVKENRVDDARTHLRLCLLVWPRSVDVHLLAARTERVGGNLDGAEAELDECRRLHGGPTEAIQLEYLLLRVQSGEEDEVEGLLLTYVDKNDPDTPVIFETLSGAYIYRLRYGRAYATLSRWIERTPNAPLPYYRRGIVAQQMESHEDAMKDYEKALEADPDFVPALLRLAEMWLERSNPPEALAHLERLMRLDPNNPEVTARLGECRLLQDRPQEARRLMEAAEQKLPDDTELLLALAKLDLQENRLAEAESRLRHALQADPFSPGCQFALVDCLRRQGRDQEADAALAQFETNKALLLRANDLLKKEAQHPTKDAQGASDAGILLLRVGQDKQGVYWLTVALRRDPRHEPSLRALADYYERKGDAKQAATLRERLASTPAGLFGR